MQALDLTKAPPRSPQERLVGVVFIPRTIDKMRALLPGGNIGEHHLHGASLNVLAKIGIDPDEMQRVVALARSDDEVAEWLQKHADLSHANEINEFLATFGPSSAPPAVAEDFHSQLEPEVANTGYRHFMEALDLDDAAYATRAQG